MNTLEKWLNVPAIPGFDAVKEGRKWKREAAREVAGMSREERRAHTRSVLEHIYGKKPARRAAKRPLVHAH